jgi:hypothetical protein
MKLCKELQEGFSIVSWTCNDPMVIPVPIDLNNQSLFCPVFWQIFSLMEKRWLLLSQQNVPHDRSLIVNNPQEERDRDLFRSILQRRNNMLANESEERRVVVMDPQAEPNAWLTRTGWADHLQHCSKAQLHQLSFPIRDDEIQLRRVSDCICQVIDQAVTFAQSVDKNSPSLVALYVVDDTTPKVPFNARLKGDTWRKYISLIRKIVTVIFRLECSTTTTTTTVKPPYLLTPEQSLLIHTVMDGTDENSQNTENCLKFLLSLIDQQITSEAHECIFLSALSVLSIKDDMNFEDAQEARIELTWKNG